MTILQPCSEEEARRPQPTGGVVMGGNNGGAAAASSSSGPPTNAPPSHVFSTLKEGRGNLNLNSHRGDDSNGEDAGAGAMKRRSQISDDDDPQDGMLVFGQDEGRQDNGGAANNNGNDLPDVEAYKTQMALNGTPSKTKHRDRRLCLLQATLVGLVVVAVIIVSTTIGLLYGGSKSKSRRGGGGPSTSGLDGILSLKGKLGRQTELMELAATNNWSAHHDIYKEGSPQHSACAWLAMEDPARLSITDAPRDSGLMRQLHERYAAATVFYALGPNPDLTIQMDWMTGKHICDWSDEVDATTFKGKSYRIINADYDATLARTNRQGIICNGLKVVGLALPGFGLKGDLPREIEAWEDLEYLDLSGNNIHSLPGSLTKCPKFASLEINDNADGFTSFPIWLYELENLEVLSMAANAITGDLPQKLDRLQKLRVLNLDSNDLTDNLAELKGLDNLEALFLGGNFFTGGITDVMLDSWPRLEILDISDNSLGGALPKTLLLKTSLSVIDLSGNKYYGGIPEDVEKDDMNLVSLNLWNNDLSGSIPPNIVHLSKLEHLDLSKNAFTSGFPTNVTGLTQLRYLSLERNRAMAAGNIPSEIGLLTNLETLSLRETNRSGRIPREVNQLKQLLFLDLGENQLTGKIRRNLFGGSLKKLKYLLLNNNELEGTLPESLSLLTDLETLLIHKNKLFGSAKGSVCSDEGERVLQNLHSFISDCKVKGDLANTVLFDCECCTSCCSDDPDRVYQTCPKTVWHEDQRSVWDIELINSNYGFVGNPADDLDDDDDGAYAEDDFDDDDGDLVDDDDDDDDDDDIGWSPNT